MRNGHTTLVDITSDDRQLILNQNSPSGMLGGGVGNVLQGVADINRCIAIILSTLQESDPLRPTFACGLSRWLDAPINIARPHLVRELVRAIRKWEPRVRVLSPSVNLVPDDPTGNANAHLDIMSVWQLKVNVGGPGGPQPSEQLSVTVPKDLK